jgi:succinate dehydrogenase flavin-adding protein (antitoxin of CptAB toxin-antitoxin module)
MLELDLVLANFLQQHGAGLTAQQWAEFDQLLDLPDQDLWSVLRDTHVADSELVALLRVNQGSL